MTKLIMFILVLGLFTSMRCFSQNSNEIGIGLTSDSDHRIFLNYKLALKDKRSINFRLSQGYFKTRNISDHGYYEITSPSETYYEESYLTIREVQTRLTIGPEFQIRESNFSWALEGVVGYGANSYEVVADKYDVFYYNTDPKSINYYSPSINTEVTDYNKREYLITGIQGRISLKAMATERLGIKLFGEVGMDCGFQLSPSEKYVKEPKPFPETSEGAANSDSRINYLTPQFRIGASIYLAHKRFERFN